MPTSKVATSWCRGAARRQAGPAEAEDAGTGRWRAPAHGRDRVFPGVAASRLWSAEPSRRRSASWRRLVLTLAASSGHPIGGTSVAATTGFRVQTSKLHVRSARKTFSSSRSGSCGAGQRRRSGPTSAFQALELDCRPSTDGQRFSLTVRSKPPTRDLPTCSDALPATSRSHQASGYRFCVKVSSAPPDWRCMALDAAAQRGACVSRRCYRGSASWVCGFRRSSRIAPARALSLSLKTRSPAVMSLS